MPTTSLSSMLEHMEEKETDRHENALAAAEQAAEVDPFARKTLLINGFSREETFMIVDTIKKLFGPGNDIIFAMTTKNSVKRPLEDILVELGQDHAYLKENPPKPGKNPF